MNSPLKHTTVLSHLPSTNITLHLLSEKLVNLVYTEPTLNWPVEFYDASLLPHCEVFGNTADPVLASTDMNSDLQKTMT